MGNNGLQLLYGADVLNLRHQEKFRGAVCAVVVKILAKGIGPAKAHATVFRGCFPGRPPAVLAGVDGKVDGPVELGAAFDHGKDKALRAGFQGRFDLRFAGLAQTGEGRGPTAFNGPKDVGEARAAKRAVFHVHGHPVVARPGHELGHIGRRQLQPCAHGGFVRRQQRANFVYSHNKAACRRRVKGQQTQGVYAAAGSDATRPGPKKSAQKPQLFIMVS